MFCYKNSSELNLNVDGGGVNIVRSPSVFIVFPKTLVNLVDVATGLYSLKFLTLSRIDMEITACLNILSKNWISEN